MMTRYVSVLVFAFTCAVAPARADEKNGRSWQLEITVKSTDSYDCKVSGPGDSPKTQDILNAKVSDPVGKQIPSPHALEMFLVETTEGGERLISFGKIDAQKSSAEVSAAALAGKKIVLKDGEKTVCGPLSVESQDQGKENGGANDKAAARVAQEFFALDSQAQKDKPEFMKHEVSANGLNRDFVLHHLPSGKPVASIPAHITEKDTVKIAIVIPEGAVPNLEVVTCDAVPTFRVRGSVTDVAAALGRATFQSAEFHLHPFPDAFRCAGSFTYKLTVTMPDGLQSSTTTTIRVDPIYYFAVGAAPVFDFGHPSVLTLRDRPNAAGTGTEKFISQTNDYSGLRVLITLSLHPFGANFEDWSPLNFLAPMIAVDPSRLTRGFAAGLKFSPMPELGVVGGVTVFQSERLVEGANVAAGQVWNASGDIPKQNVFNPSSVGFFFGINLDADLLGKLFPKS